LEDAIHIRSFEQRDYEACAKIYQAGLDTGIATFETQVPNWETWNAKFCKECRYVAEAQSTVVGWIMLSPFSKRLVYKGVAEVTLYVALESQGKQIGTRLLNKLIEESEISGFWTLQAKIFTTNKASIKLFEKNGFRIVGLRERLGKRDGVWHDNMLLERRSDLIN